MTIPNPKAPKSKEILKFYTKALQHISLELLSELHALSNGFNVESIANLLDLDTNKTNTCLNIVNILSQFGIVKQKEDFYSPDQNMWVIDTGDGTQTLREQVKTHIEQQEEASEQQNIHALAQQMFDESNFNPDHPLLEQIQGFQSSPKPLKNI